jgi:hypothetical protein
MSKKNDKRLCWSCDAEVSCHLNKCPYCAADVTNPMRESLFKQDSSFASPFQTAPKESKQAASLFSSDYFPDQFTSVPEPVAMSVKEEVSEEEEVSNSSNKKEMSIFLLLLPGIVFFLFGLVLLLFSEEGVLTLSWNQNLAVFYFLASLPLMYIGWKAIN